MPIISFRSIVEFPHRPWVESTLRAGGCPEFIAGMGKVGGKFVIILNLAKVLSADELVNLGVLPSPP